MAREHIAAQGVDGLTLAGVARRLGVSPPALYRYFDGRQGLIRAVYDDLTADLVNTIELAVQRQDPDDVAAQIHAATRAVLTWTLDNAAGFSLLMGAHYPAIAEAEDGIPRVISESLGDLFGEFFVHFARSGQLNYPEDDEIPPALIPQLKIYRESVKPGVPLGVAYMMIYCWRQIYGILCMATHKHLSFAFDDPQPLYETMIVDLLSHLGVKPSANLR
ncbi:TetR/AcrR family transcriptional regulator [Nonomuraea sp. NPDC049419]|uniref:TetR/AcrR family transcriptional regulator n=1 Tax=Nonomuraea sp. NPDC049419 TaxID=3155772 RepID=UPI003433D4A7